MLNHFAGPIFTTQDVIIFCIVAFVIVSVPIGLIIFFGKRLIDKKRTANTKNDSDTKSSLSFRKAMLISSALIVAIILIFFVIPTVISDASLSRKQQSCALQARYDSPADDNSERATAQSQSIYRDCLDR